MAGLCARHAFRYARRKVKDLFTNEQWYPVYRFEDAPGPADDFTGLIELMPGEDRYWADPFPVRTRDGRTFLFFEELRYEDPKGRILAVEIDREKGAGEPFLVLERDYHLSYPHVFEWQGQYWMVPESSKNRTVTLFRCVSFPDRWVVSLLFSVCPSPANRELGRIESRLRLECATAGDTHHSG